jgi:hypothetical protein
MPVSLDQSLTHLTFVTDGDTAQLFGIACIVNALTSSDLKPPRLTDIWLVAPTKRRRRVEELLSPLSLSLRFIDGPVRQDDQYFVQLGLIELFEKVPAQDHVLALDYDHLILRPEEFPFFCSAAGIQVSSEFSENTGEQMLRELTRLTVGVDYPARHLNISAIYGRAEDLRVIGRRWLKAYHKLYPYTHSRNRVELAFALAADEVGMPVAPCDRRVQANFANPTKAARIFHYGGESEKSRFIKRKLARQIECINRNNLVRNFERIHFELIAELRTIL